jgi:hypothetical protein
MGEQTTTPVEQAPKTARVQNPARLASTLVVGLLLGACLGPALFLAIDRIELKGDLLFSFAIGAFLMLGACFVLAAAAALLILPRFFSNVRGTLTGVVDDLTQASRAHAQGNSDKALDHVGRAIGEGVAWYSIGATRRFSVQAALGLLVAFGGTIGAVLLFSQNALLRDQNGLLREQNRLTQSQLQLLTDQNEKIDKQLLLLTDQNAKIDQQTAVADAQKRSAFVTELFSIVQEVSKEIGRTDRADGSLSKELVSRIAVLTSSAVPYRYQLHYRDDRDRGSPVALSPERGQLVVALTRLKISLAPLIEAGANFTYSDLRGFQLSDVDLSSANLEGCDFSFSEIQRAKFLKTRLDAAVMFQLFTVQADFSGARFGRTKIEGSTFLSSSFDRANFDSVTFKNSQLDRSSFVDSAHSNLAFENVSVNSAADLPQGIPWSPVVKEDHAAAKGRFFSAERPKPVNFSFSFKVPDSKVPSASRQQ